MLLVSRILNLLLALALILWWVCPRVAAAVSCCGILVDRWVVPHFAVRACFD